MHPVWSSSGLFFRTLKKVSTGMARLHRALTCGVYRTALRQPRGPGVGREGFHWPGLSKYTRGRAEAPRLGVNLKAILDIPLQEDKPLISVPARKGVVGPHSFCEAQFVRPALSSSRRKTHLPDDSEAHPRFRFGRAGISALQSTFAAGRRSRRV